ncbi:MAG: sugar transferase [Kiritimatiellae bacterium]|nr:sugar transferase [Kiritimatiellia bacterium]
MKRTIDYFCALIGGIILLPLLLLLWICVVLEGGLPGIFRQQRVGRSGRDFTLYKFRTMGVRPGAEQGSFDAGRVARVTRVGRILRKCKLDELPQFWNVLKGDMALVGPRPEVRKWVDVYPERWAAILSVRPGITDPAAIIYRNEEELLANADDPERMYLEDVLPHKLDLYEEYIKNQSVLEDIKILVRTFCAIIRS